MCAGVCRVDSDPFFPLEAEDLIADSGRNERGGSGSSLGESTAFDSATCSLGVALSYAVLPPNIHYTIPSISDTFGADLAACIIPPDSPRSPPGGSGEIWGDLGILGGPGVSWG